MNLYDETATQRAASMMGIEIIKHFEGLRLESYLDAVGAPTIGYGSTLGVQMGTSISEQDAEALLIEDMSRFEDGVNDLVCVSLKQCQFDALVSFSFNLGVGALSKSTLLKKLNSGDYAGAQKEFSRWVYAGGQKLSGLVKRRDAEAALFGGSAWRSMS